LAGGIGAAKFIEGFINVIDQDKLDIIVNTGDDIELFGLQICPDLDIITYTIANIVDKNKGWGIKDDTFICLKMLKNYYDIGWFNIGDKDLSTHIFRTDLYKKGLSKTEITKRICERLGVTANIIPMSNEKVETFIKTPKKLVHFEEFFIKYKNKPKILDITFQGISTSKPSENILKKIKSAGKIIICPSNPIVSIGTILSVPGIKNALNSVKEKIYAISPIIEGKAVKGPTKKFLEFFNIECSCLGVAKYYKSFLGNFIIDIKDRNYRSEIEKLGIKTYCHNTIMENLEKKKDLAKFLIDLL